MASIKESKEKVHFPGLNGIRSIAALTVIFFHINHNVGLYGLTPIKYFINREEMSRMAVVLFLVLSGFLITYLLLIEKEAYGFIGYRKFYMRRILRIWPLYYVILFIALIILLSGHYENSFELSLKTIGIYAAFLSNFALLKGMALLTIAPLWSVGIEEQFYLFWPWLVSKSQNVHYALWLFLIAYILIKLFFLKVIKTTIIYAGLDLFAFDALAIGGIATYWYFSKNKVLKLIYHPFVQIIAWTFFLVSLIIGKIRMTEFLDKEIYAAVFAVIILNVSTNSISIITLENKFFNFMGRVSYGFYLCHMTVLYLLSFFIKTRLDKLHSVALQFVLLYVIIITATLAIAHLSYKYFESGFIRLKTRFTNIPSSD
jgi:peptidoglycan/LPS O-acetylase OafA/YrhL